MQKIRELVVPARVKVSAVIFSNSRDFVSEDLLKSFFFIRHIDAHRGHKIANSISWLQTVDHLSTHGLPHVFIFKVPGDIADSIILLNICEKALVVEYAPDLSVKPMNPGVIDAHLLTSKGLPEDDFWPLLYSILSREYLSLKDPSMTAFSIGSDTNISIEPESNEQIAKENGVIFGISAASSQEALH